MKRKITIKAAIISIGLLFALPFLRPAFADTLLVPQLCELGKSFYRMGSYDNALSEFNKVLLLDPANKTALRYISNIFAKEIARENTPAKNTNKSSKKVNLDQQNPYSPNTEKTEAEEKAITKLFI